MCSHKSNSAIELLNCEEYFPFLELPAELRILIYEYVFAPLSGYVKPYGSLPAAALHGSNALSLLLTCRFIHTEAVRLAFQNHTFILTRSSYSLKFREPLPLSSHPHPFDIMSTITSLLIPSWQYAFRNNIGTGPLAQLFNVHVARSRCEAVRVKASPPRRGYYFRYLLDLVYKIETLKCILVGTDRERFVDEYLFRRLPRMCARNDQAGAEESSQKRRQWKQSETRYDRKRLYLKVEMREAVVWAVQLREGDGDGEGREVEVIPFFVVVNGK
ncbi:hypothetical protein P154DRAFT_349876 [Amniculicola lignicola CBS 123094]|uniref:F-box domain-containing protein n=1 Tax=Amniculicola lignicola CBS 123094 TaxID=1392246 RepID=A0A6A5W7Q7_9PLEO|nr:hypothetical protein P154DRAFT_349876 [Amniculicola lignicola CBS 123094]